MSTLEELIAANPFPGLRSFMTGEADRFFGRQEQIEALALRLDEAPLIAVAGASGCGKSSLVLAGLLSKLARDRQSGGTLKWRPAVLGPGDHPIGNLAAGLVNVLDMVAADDENRVASLEGRLRLGGRGLAEIARLARLEPDVRVLVVVDQFEEIFRFKRMIDPEEAAAFVKLLLVAANEPDSLVSVVLTLRSDALGLCADFPDLPEAINRGQYLVPKLTRDQRKEAIAKPVELRGCKIAPRLVQRILNDVTSDFDDLPIMQHVLTRTWQKWAKNSQGTRPIDLEDYEATGGAANALSDHADEGFNSLTGLAAVVERVFRAITERGAEGAEIRRPLKFYRLCDVVGGDKASVEQVVERFRRPDTAFLLPSQEKKLAANPVIDISHESLIRQWRRMREWTQSEVRSRAELETLVGAASRYAQKEGGTLPSRDLERVLEWRKKEQPTVAWISLCTGGDGASQWDMAQSFIAASERAVASGRRRKQALVWGSRGFALIAVVASLLVALSTLRMQRQAKSHELGNHALLELDQDPARSAHLALAAIDQDPDNRGAEDTLRKSLATLETAHTEHITHIGDPITDARFTNDKSRLIVASGNEVRVLDARSYQVLNNPPFQRKERLLKAWLIAKNSLLVTWTEDGQAQTQSVNGDPSDLPACKREGTENFILTLVVSDDERHIATGCLNGEITVWDVTAAGPQLQSSLGGAGKAPITALSFSADNKYLASGDVNGTATIWKLRVSEPWIGAGRKGSKESPITHSAAIRDIGFHPTNPALLATASDDNTAIVWQLDLSGRGLAPIKTGKPNKWKLKHDRPVIFARFTGRKDAPGLLMTISDKRIRFWKNEQPGEVRHHDDWVNDANTSDDSELAVSAGQDGTARVWSTRSGSPVAALQGHRGAVTRAFFDPTGRIVTASQDGDLRVWRLHPPFLLAAGSKWANSAAFDTAGKRVAACGEESCSIIDVPDVTQSLHQKKVASNSDIEFVSWSADGRLLLGCEKTEDIYQKLVPILWDADSGNVITPKWLTQWRTAAFSAETNELVTVNSDGAIAVWDAATLKDDNAQPKHRFRPVFGRRWAEMSPDGRWIAAIESDKVALLDPAKPESPPRMLVGHRGDIKTVKFSRDSRWLVTASSDRTARVWPVDQRPGQPESVELTGGHGAALSYAAFNRDGSQVVTGSVDHTIGVWDARQGRPLAILRWHSESVNEARFSPDGQHILSASDDGTVKLSQCDACNQTVAQLRERVHDEALVTEDELKKIQDETRVIQPYRNLLASFSFNR